MGYAKSIYVHIDHVNSVTVIHPGWKLEDDKKTTL